MSETPENPHTEETPTTEEQTVSNHKYSVPKENFIVFTKRALSILLHNPIYVLLITLSLAALDAFLLRFSLDLFGIENQISLNVNMIQPLLTFSAFNIVKVLIIGPIEGLLAVFLSYSFLKGKEASPYQALNFVLRNYGRLFVPYLIAQLCIQIGVIVVIPAILFMLQFAFLESISSLEKHPKPLTRSKAMTKGLRGSLVFFVMLWVLYSQFSILLVIDAAQNLPVLICLNFISQLLYFFVLCAFFCVYEYRSYQLIVRKAKKEKTAQPVRSKPKPSLGLGWVVMIASFAAVGSTMVSYFEKQSYGNCVQKATTTAFHNSTPGNFVAKTTCEQAKKTCSDAPPCEIKCNLTLGGQIHPKSQTQMYKIMGAPNLAQCKQ